MRVSFLIASVVWALASGGSLMADNFSWTFQRTGYRSTSGITALSMRGNLSWPVVYGIDEARLHAYSLFPVANPDPVPVAGPQPTYFHRIGTNLTQTFLPSSNIYLRAASGLPDSFGVSVQSPQLGSQPVDATVWGTSTGGFNAPQPNTQAIDFDDQGAPFVAATAMIPLQPGQNEKLYDVALSAAGDVGAITQPAGGLGPLRIWQQSALLGGKWLSSILTPTGENTLYGPTTDLVYDSNSSPHVVGLNRQSSNSLVAYRFDIPSGQWQFNTLDTALQSPPIADVAAASNDAGIVGAAWVNNGTLKYAYLDSNKINPNWVVTNVAAALPNGKLLETIQGVGLAYDKSGLPVISLVERGTREIWIAYDPPAVVAPTPGDFNGDGSVDGGDLGQWAANFGDGMSGEDFLTWQMNVGAASVTPTATSVPEPAAFSIILVGAAAVAGGGRRRGVPCREHRAN